MGAGLPVIATLQTLLDSGDTVHAIEGSLSGTLGYLCARLQAGDRFSEAVRDAKNLGYTEPDPREDLAGRDAARKALILGRMLGYALEIDDVEVEALFPPEMAFVTPSAFLDDLVTLDAPYRQRAAGASAQGMALRYVTEVKNGRCRVGLRTVPLDSELGRLNGPQSLVVFHTARYHDLPMTIGGRGAGAEVTAAGVLGDVLALARQCR